MRVSFHPHDEEEPTEVDFDPTELVWKSQNYGQFSLEGVYVDEIERTCFVKRLKEYPRSTPFLRDHQENPASAFLPRVWGLANDPQATDGFRHYFFYEMIEGETLDRLKGELAPDHCHALLSGIFRGLRDILKRGYWHGDLDIRNVFIGPGESGELVRLIDIDSVLPLTVTFGDYLEDHHRRPNVNERYWSYLVRMCSPEQRSALSGVSLTQAAMMYFAVDLYFFIHYPQNAISLKPSDLERLMREGSRRYFSDDARRAWRSAHAAILANPGEGGSWREVERFVVSAFGFDRGLSPTKRRPSLLDDLFRLVGELFGGVTGR